MENVDNCDCNYSHFYSLYIKFNAYGKRKRGQIVEKYTHSTKDSIKLWIKNSPKIHFVSKNWELYIKNDNKVDNLWITTPIFAHSSKDKGWK